MQLDGVLSILKFFIILLVAVLIIMAVMFVGGLLVAAVSLPVLLVLPTVRGQFVAFVESVTGNQIESLTDWRFVALYVLFVEIFGFALILGSAWLAEQLGSLDWLVPDGPAGPALLLAVVGLVGTGVVLGVRRATGARLRTVGEWLAFLTFISVLAFVAAFIVPYLIFQVVGPFVWRVVTTIAVP